MRHSIVMIVIALAWLGINAIAPLPGTPAPPTVAATIPAQVTLTVTRPAPLLPAATPSPTPIVRR